MLLLYVKQDSIKINYFKDLDINIYSNKKSNEEFNFLTAICMGRKKNREQLRHISIMLKSAAMLTRTYLRFHIFIDKSTLQKYIEAILSKWPLEIRSRLI